MPQVNRMDISTADAGSSTGRAHAASALRRHLRRGIVQGLVLAAGGIIVGLGINAVRPEPLPWVAREPYTILVPCPEQVGKAEALQPSDPQIRHSRSLVIDARTSEAFKEWHLPGAILVEFDWLGPPVDDEVKRTAERVAKSGAHRVIVYGDGDDPDSGREWARLISGAKLKNVFYVQGGAPALKASQGGSR